MEGSLTQDDGHTTHVFDDVPESAINSKVPLQALYTVSICLKYSHISIM